MPMTNPPNDPSFAIAEMADLQHEVRDLRWAFKREMKAKIEKRLKEIAAQSPTPEDAALVKRVVDALEVDGSLDRVMADHVYI